MGRDNDSFDKAFDLLLTEAAVRADENIGKKLKDSDEEIEFSQEHEQKMDKLFKCSRKIPLAKYLKRCACVFVAAVILASICIFSVSAWRVRFLNFVMEFGESNIDYRFDDTNSYSDDEIGIAYIPIGFDVTKNIGSDDDVFLKFENQNEYFTVTIESISGQSSIDTENATIENLKINDNDAVYASNENINSLIWGDGYFSYAVIGNIEKSEIIKIAENIKMNKK